MSYVAIDQSVLALVLNALDRDAAEGKEVRKEIADEVRKNVRICADLSVLEDWYKAIHDSAQPHGNRLQTIASKMYNLGVRVEIEAKERIPFKEIIENDITCLEMIEKILPTIEPSADCSPMWNKHLEILSEEVKAFVAVARQKQIEKQEILGYYVVSDEYKATTLSLPTAIEVATERNGDIIPLTRLNVKVPLNSRIYATPDIYHGWAIHIKNRLVPEGDVLQHCIDPQELARRGNFWAMIFDTKYEGIIDG